MPDLDFRVDSAEVLEFAAVPTLQFKLRVVNLENDPIRSITLSSQIRIATRQRQYSSEEQERLLDVFGESQRWSTTLSSMLWTQTTVQVPPFSEDIVVDMPVTCTYDFEVVSAKYFDALDDGEVPLEFLFSGTIFYQRDGNLQVERISWEKEAGFRMPVQIWREMMEHYFPNSAWLRLRKDVFDRLYAYKSRSGLPTWEAALNRMLDVEQGKVER